MRNIALLSEYDGTNFHGWQTQGNCRTVQEELTKAIRKITSHGSILIGCSRTDSGVHATGHVSNFHTDSAIPVEKFPIALNSNLPGDVHILDAVETGQGFHAGYDAKAKRYRYRISFGDKGRALDRNRIYYVKMIPDISAMKEAAAAFCGTHDFRSFMASGGETKTTVRTITKLDICETGCGADIVVEGNGFLYNMVRIMAGTIYYAGIGKIAPGIIEEIILARDRKFAGKTLPAHGLYLEKVFYTDVSFGYND